MHESGRTRGEGIVLEGGKGEEGDGGDEIGEQGVREQQNGAHLKSEQLGVRLRRIAEGEVRLESYGRDQLKTQFSRLLDQSQRQISELEVASNELGVYREKNEMKQSSKIKELALNNQSLLKELKEVKTELKEKIDELDQVGQQKEEAEEELQFVKSQQSAVRIELINLGDKLY